MKLIALKADGFGPLRGQWQFDPERVTVLVDENERGKSSLLAAITAGLYGLDADRRTHRMMTPLERWKPWEGTGYRVELELESDGERYTVKRDFDSGAVEVWTDRGKDVTEKFRTGKDEFPVGRILLGLDEAEFEKCALVRQGELDMVVPADEKTRRASSLHARLENAADTKVGDTNATEAMQVLESATSSYTCDELGTTLKVETAIQRLSDKAQFLETELHTLEQDQVKIEEPMAELAGLAEEEKGLRDQVGRLDAERRTVLASELHRKLDENDLRKKELAKLKDEAATLAKAAELPPNAEADLRETIARHEEAIRSLETLEQRRRDQQVRERSRIEDELADLASIEHVEPELADRFVALAGELTRVSQEDSRLRDEAFHYRDSLAGQGHMPERIQFLTTQFEELTEEDQRLIRGQSDMALAYQTEVAELEAERGNATETLREIDSERQGKRVPGWVLTALGFAVAVAGLVLLGLKMSAPIWVGMLAAGAVAMMVGAPLLVSGASGRQADREEALKQLSDAQRRLNQLRSRRAEGEVKIGELARQRGYRDSVEMMRDWAEYTRMMDASAPVMHAQRQMEMLREQRSTALAEVKELLAKVGGGAAEPQHLEHIARKIRRRTELKRMLEELERGWGWIDEEKRVAEASASGLKERAIRLMKDAGVEYDAEKPWSEHMQRVSDLARGGARHEMLVKELIPAAEKRLMSEQDVASIRRQVEGLEAQGTTGAVMSRPVSEIDADAVKARERLDQLQRRREELRVGVEETSRRVHSQRAEKTGELERVRVALESARRFSAAVTLARETIGGVAVETHRRWADWLNERVGELLHAVGTHVDSVRFGEDLDFSVKFDRNRQQTRGRAMAQLSAGARDQLHLAVRLAVSEYLSRGQTPLPLLVDDAFATSDDARARAGMKLLLEHFSKQHQVIVVTCHRGRHEAFARDDQALWERRVHWVNATSESRA